MAFGFALSPVHSAIAVAWSPASLFTAGEQGVWYDPSDFSTMFQDAAGTTPVTAVEQPVGRINDKSGRGNHATQTTAASRPTLSARVNLLTKSEQFDDAAWDNSGASISTNTPDTTDPLGGNTADKYASTITTSSYVRQTSSQTVNTAYTFSVYAKKGSQKWLCLVNNAAVSGTWNVWYDLDFGVLGTKPVGADATIILLENGWYRCTLTVTTAASIGANLVDVRVTSGDNTNNVGSGDYIYIWGAQLETGSTATRYQRVTTASDYDSVGFPYFLRFDGVDDGLATASIDFTATDKMSVFAGYLNNNVTGFQAIAELSASADTNNGAFGCLNNGTSIFSMDRGASARVRVSYGSALAAGVALVQTDEFDLSMSGLDSVDTRKNQVELIGTTTDTTTGGGNFGAHPLYIGRRAGATFPFNGHIYSLIVRGAASTDAQITSAEKYVAGKTGVTL